jgi:hypothetical protein
MPPCESRNSRAEQGEYIEGGTFMHHRRVCFTLGLTEARSGGVEYLRRSGQLLGEPVHAAGTVYGAVKLVVEAQRALRDFNRLIGIDKQTRIVAKGGARSCEK